MTTATTETKSGRGGARGPRTFKDTPTPRDRVIGESLQAKVKELTGREISVIDVLAVKFSLSRWYEDPATKQLMNDMSEQLKRAEAQTKADKLKAELAKLEAELDSGEFSDDDSEADEDDAEDESAYAAASDTEDEDDEDVFGDEDDSVEASF